MEGPQDMKVAAFFQENVGYNLNSVRSGIAFILESLGFKDMIYPNDTVAIKPNWIRQSHQNDPREWASLITHPVVITSVLEYVLSLLHGSGRVIITDGPQTDSSWDMIMARMKPELWKSMGKRAGVDVEIIDLREHEWVLKSGFVTERKELPGDPLGHTVVDLGRKSEFLGHRVSSMGYYGADYNRQETNDVHNGECNKYRVSRSVIEADVFINLPKLKTHKKAGITCSLKNLVGINTYKNWLPHYTIGTPEQNGDQFPFSNPRSKAEIHLMSRLKKLLHSKPYLNRVLAPYAGVGKKLFGDTDKTIRSGNWYGNDTIWRTVLDLNKILYYANANGSLREPSKSNAKRYFTIVDGIISGEGNGPSSPERVESGVLIGASNPVAADCACARIMGFDYRRIPVLYRALDIKNLPLVDFEYGDIEIISNDQGFCGLLEKLACKKMFAFKPPFGWKDHIELKA